MTCEKLFVREKLKYLFDRLSIYRVIENLMEHGINFLQCSYINTIIKLSS